MKKKYQSLLSEELYYPKIDRLFSIDLLKAMSIIAVVSFHSILVPITTYADSELAIDIIFSPLRFCVPVFLTISFLLMEKGLVKQTSSTWDAIYKRLNRLLIPTLFWFAIAASLKLINHNPLSEVIATIFNGEIFTGAYYLLVVIQLTPIFIWFRHLLNKPLVLILTICLQVLVFLYVYALTFLPEHEDILAILKTIDKPLLIYWFVYMAFGCFFWDKWSSIVKISQQISTPIKVLIVILYSVIQMFEFRWCFFRFQGEIRPFDYVTFSCIFSVLVFFLCFASIQENQLPVYIRKTVSILSKYSLGIFCINGLLCQIFGSIGLHLFAEARFNFYEILILKLVSWFFLLSISLGLSILLNKIGLKAVVR